MRAFYNEIDPYCAAWLRNLIEAGEIPFGVVDERSIEDIAPTELAGFAQCHFFAGLGGWPLAMRRAGWPDDRPAWTGSCPCQPFSTAGKGGGFADERHLWPAFDWLIGQCRPDIVLGEQVEGPAGRQWLDLVATDLEGHGYAFGTAVFPAAGVGAPQIRHRTYWVGHSAAEGLQRSAWGGSDGERVVWGIIAEGRLASRLANSDNARLEGRLGMPERADQCAAGPRGLVGGVADRDGGGCERGRPSEAGYGRNAPRLELERLRDAGRLARTDEGQLGRLASCGGSEPDRQARGWQQGDGGASGDCEAGGVADAEDLWLGGKRGELPEPQEHGIRKIPRQGNRGVESGYGSRAGRPGPVNGFWRASDWLYCRDDRWRPVEPGTFPLVAGASARVGRLRAYGNAICVPQAQAFIEAVMDAWA